MTAEQPPPLAPRKLLERRLVQYMFAVLVVAVAFAVRRLAVSANGTGAPFLLFFGAVLVTCVVAGYRAGILATLLSVPLGAEEYIALVGREPASVAVFHGTLFALSCAGATYLAYVGARARAAAIEKADELLQSVNHCRNLIELAPEGFFLTDLDGRITEVNQAAYRMLRYEQDGLVGTRFFDLLAFDKAKELEALRAELFAPGFVHTSELTLRRKDGCPLPVEVSSNIVGDSHWQAFARDITERKRIANQREQLLARERRVREETEQVNAQLRESEERFRLTLEEAPIGMSLVGTDGRFVRVNRALCQLVGYTAEELLQLRFQDITHPDDSDLGIMLLDQLVRGEISRTQIEKRYIRKDGGIVTVLLNTAILRGPDGSPLYFISQITDITERKATEDALRFSEARFSGIISISAEAIISIDEHQRITLFNNGAEQIFGYARDEVIGAPLDVVIPERFRALHRKHVARFMAGPETARPMAARDAELIGLRKSGEEFPIVAAISKLQLDNSITMTVVLHDVTEQRRVEREQRYLAEAGKILSSSLDYEQTLTTVGELVVRELANWCIIQIAESEAHPRRLRVVPDDPSLHPLVEELERLPFDPSQPHVTRSVWNTRQPIVYERLRPGDLDAFAQSPDHLRLMRAIAPRSLMIVPLLLRGRVLGVLMFILSRDDRVYTTKDLPFATAIADRAALAIENGRLYHSAVHATQLRDQVLGVVAHDLRNPLSLIQLQAAMLQPKPGEQERRNPKPPAMILRAADRMSHLIQDLLDVSQIEAGRLSIEQAPVATTKLLADLVEAQRRLATASSVELRLELEPDLPDIWADRDRLSQVLENVIGNAIKFTPRGGQITIGARRRGDHVMFSVADTGTGIPADSLPHVFEHFWQARKGRHGAGLGLPISRGIVEAHGGRIWVESAAGCGTTFYFTIPLVPADARNQQRPSSARAALSE